MDREEILAMSRKENKDRDIAELEILNLSGNVAFMVGAVVCVLLLIAQGLIQHRPNPSCWAIYFCMAGTRYLVKFVKMKRKSDCAAAVLFLAVSVFHIVEFILSMV